MGSVGRCGGVPAVRAAFIGWALVVLVSFWWSVVLQWLWSNWMEGCGGRSWVFGVRCWWGRAVVAGLESGWLVLWFFSSFSLFGWLFFVCVRRG